MKTSATSLPAFFAASAAALKLPENNSLIAVPKNPIVSINDSTRSIKFFLMASPNCLTYFVGFSKTSLKKSMTAGMLSTKKLTKSEKTRVTNSMPTAKNLATFSFFINISCKNSNAFTTMVIIPNDFNADPIVANAPPAFFPESAALSAPFLTPSNPFSVFLRFSCASDVSAVTFILTSSTAILIYCFDYF